MSGRGLVSNGPENRVKSSRRQMTRPVISDSPIILCGVRMVARDFMIRLVMEQTGPSIGVARGLSRVDSSEHNEPLVAYCLPIAGDRRTQHFDG